MVVFRVPFEIESSSSCLAPVRSNRDRSWFDPTLFALSSERTINYGTIPLFASVPSRKTTTIPPLSVVLPPLAIFPFAQTLLETRRDLTRQVERLQDALDSANEVPKNTPSSPSRMTTNCVVR